MLTDLLPSWAAKLSPAVLSCILFFVGAHVVALLALAYHYNTAKYQPDFKAKLK
jgi:hypothetical protein